MVFDSCVDFFLSKLLRLFILDYIHASLSITEWCIFREFTSTEMHRLSREFLVDLEFKWLKACAEVRWITEWLVLWHSAWAPIVVLCSKHYIFYFIWGQLCLDWEREFAFFLLETPLKVVTSKLMNWDSVVAQERWMKKRVNVKIALSPWLASWLVASV